MASPTVIATPRSSGRKVGRTFGDLSPRTTFLLRRLARMAGSMAIVVVATFAMIHLVPGDPVRAAVGTTATPELVARARADMGLDLPLPQQFVDYVAGLLHGDLGTSLQSNRPVSEVLVQRVPPTLTLGLSAFVLAGLVAVPLGIGTALTARSVRYRKVGLVASALLGLAIAIPDYLVAVLMIAIFSITLGWLPAAGWGSPAEAVLPILTLAAGPTAYLARIVHVEMLGVLGNTYMTTARAKRLPARLMYLRHAFPNMLSAALTVGGVLLAGLVAATVLVETVFAIPGLGTTIVTSIAAKDYPMVQGVVLFYAALVLLLNLVVDLVLMSVDPRSSIAEG